MQGDDKSCYENTHTAYNSINKSCNKILVIFRKASYSELLWPKNRKRSMRMSLAKYTEKWLRIRYGLRGPGAVLKLLYKQ